MIGAYLLTAIVVGGYLGRSTLVDDEVQAEVSATADGDGGAQEDHPHEAEARDLVVPLERRAHHVAAPDAEELVGDEHHHQRDADALDYHVT